MEEEEETNHLIASPNMSLLTSLDSRGLDENKTPMKRTKSSSEGAEGLIYTNSSRVTPTRDNESYSQEHPTRMSKFQYMRSLQQMDDEIAHLRLKLMELERRNRELEYKVREDVTSPQLTSEETINVHNPHAVVNYARSNVPTSIQEEPKIKYNLKNININMFNDVEDIEDQLSQLETLCDQLQPAQVQELLMKYITASPILAQDLSSLTLEERTNPAKFKLAIIRRYGGAYTPEQAYEKSHQRVNESFARYHARLERLYRTMRNLPSSKSLSETDKKCLVTKFNRTIIKREVKRDHFKKERNQKWSTLHLDAQNIANGNDRADALIEQ